MSNIEASAINNRTVKNVWRKSIANDGEKEQKEFVKQLEKLKTIQNFIKQA